VEEAGCGFRTSQRSCAAASLTSPNNINKDRSFRELAVLHDSKMSLVPVPAASTRLDKKEAETVRLRCSGYRPSDIIQ
jgi:hypothetical protein